LGLDELPQLWNVLVGDMSFVGPRPILEDEIGHYGDAFQLYARVRPGITGMWNSGRNLASYGQRVHLDATYVRNWSPWLDLCVLARAARIALFGESAY
jgi:lipopolysaccharide/colanic/teichoic acid biosynthesis glycosyltransferase